MYVDGARGGGEPFVIYSHAGQDLVYSSHEGTTLTQSSNFTGGTNCDIVPSDPTSSGGYLCTYDNQVNMWFSSDGGQTWHHSVGDPVATGFSDPSLTEDQCVSGACNVWNTGIDLANDALYASSDGGQTWVGTAQCPPGGGDRPWLAGGVNGEVFLVTNANVGGHTFYHGTTTQVGGQNVAVSCNPNGLTDSGGSGQIYYNHHDGSVVDPSLLRRPGLGGRTGRPRPPRQVPARRGRDHDRGASRRRGWEWARLTSRSPCSATGRSARPSTAC